MTSRASTTIKAKRDRLKSNSKAIALNSTQVGLTKPALQKLPYNKNICRNIPLSNRLNHTQIVSAEVNCRSTDSNSSIQIQTYSFISF
ncbi:MAG TPA: hypothetical protein VLA84_22500 [Microcoleus sp.]|nr:hypothetical protein [Microcoleus sp.]